MSQEKYKQYLQAQFPSGAPANTSEMVLSMVTDTSEMYKTVEQEIGKTGIDSSEHEQEIRRKEQRIAIAATQSAEGQTIALTKQLADISQSRV
jgi:hypothetical protein